MRDQPNREEFESLKMTLFGPLAKEVRESIWQNIRGPILGILVCLNAIVWLMRLWPLPARYDDGGHLISASAEYDYKIKAERVDLSGVAPEPTVAPEPDRICHHHWVNGPYFVMVAGLPWEMERPSSITRIQHCTGCGLMRLNSGQREWDRGSTLQGSSIVEKRMFERAERREAGKKR